MYAQEAAEEEEVIVLEEFIVDETGAALNDTVMPTDREISGLFGEATSVLEVPRSVSLLSPEILDQFNIDDLSDLEKFGAGTQAVNYYGVAGAPTIRGVKGGTYLNGMLRAFNRNEMPLSFGSLEAIEVVKGPAPADFSPTLIGGFVNLLPKSPFFDEEAGSIEFEFDNWGRKTISADYGAPFLLPGDTPAAFRISLTGQDGESYYDDLSNDYTSVYGAIKFRPNDGMTVFIGGEYFDYKSNENPGWNRPTQNLVDNDQYVIGEAQDITSGVWLGTASRDDLYTDTRLAIEASLAEELVPQFGNLADMEFITDTDGVDKYVYTQQYFDNGGEAVTQKIDGSDVLTDPSDFADSTDVVLFGDLIFDSNSDRTFTVKGLAEFLETEKNSSYGYAFESEQTVLATKAFFTDYTLIPKTTITYGIGARYTDAKQLQDFWDEPFGRRDISQSEISPNSVILAGSQSPVGGNNQWARFGIGGNTESELLQLAAFASTQTKLIEDKLTIIASLRYEYADFDVSVPSEPDGVGAADRAAYAEAGSGNTDYLNGTIGASFEIIDGLSIYGNYLEGTSMDPAQGGALVGESNFAENEMWEVGVKASLIDNKLFASLAYYEWEQSSFNGRAGSSEALEGEGVEFETTWLATDHLTLIASYTWQEVKRVDPLGFRTIPFSDQDWALYGGALNSNFSGASFDGRDRYVDGNFGIPTDNTDLVYPGTPQQVIKLFALYEFGNGFSLNGSAVWQEEFYLDFDQQIELPDALIFSLGGKYATEKWELAATIENLSDEEYFLGSDPTFAANTLVTKAPERTYIVSFKYKF
ncbi:MAG: TonB-dependent receptor plug domain-containing protein [Verrucomicrobiota bacterium]